MIGIPELLIICVLIFFISRIIAVITRKRRSRADDSTADQQAMADLHRVLDRMEQRLQNLETIVIEKDKVEKIK